MCAIVDASIAGEVFGTKRSEAGSKFFNWLNTGSGILISGGELLNELHKTKFREWARQAILSGKILVENNQAVETRTAKLKSEKVCKSNDPHVIALAQISGARLLYTNDGNLQEDFKNKYLVDNPRGRVYSTKKYKHYTNSQKELLERKDLCMISS